MFSYIANWQLKYFHVWLRNRLLSARLEPVLRQIEKSFLTSNYRQFSTNIKTKDHKMDASFVSPELLTLRANKTGFNHFWYFSFNLIFPSKNCLWYEAIHIYYGPILYSWHHHLFLIYFIVIRVATWKKLKLKTIQRVRSAKKTAYLDRGSWSTSKKSADPDIAYH